MNSFVKDPIDLKKFSSAPTTFYDAEMLTAYWETDPEVVARILPPPLEPAARPLVSAFVANYPRTNFCPAYKEAALFVLADFEGELGNYCLSMPISDGMAMGLGREVYGFPKKMAEIELTKNGNLVEGSVSRHGIEFFSLTGTLDGRLNADDGQQILTDSYGAGLPIFNFKYSKSPDGSGFDLSPRLLKQGATLDNTVSERGGVAMSLTDSPHDPWAELAVVRPLGCTYTVGTSVLLRGTVLAEVDPPAAFLPYSNSKWDWWEDTL
jgi:acetoacetate decarboxylase